MPLWLGLHSLQEVEVVIDLVHERVSPEFTVFQKKSERKIRMYECSSIKSAVRKGVEH
jgi:hypothetical protein